MKLRNKKTGKVYNVINESIKLSVGDMSAQHIGYYTSLAELNEDWEDYEDSPYVIDMWEDDCICDAKFGVELEGIGRAKECGLYFKTKEEAEKAVEKLKAWKRLKDGGITFKNWTINQTGTIDCFATWGDNIPPSKKPNFARRPRLAFRR